MGRRVAGGEGVGGDRETRRATGDPVSQRPSEITSLQCVHWCCYMIPL